MEAPPLPRRMRMMRMRQKTTVRDLVRGLIALGSLAAVWLVAGAPFDAGW
jgi:hypothetical protein